MEIMQTIKQENPDQSPVRLNPAESWKIFKREETNGASKCLNAAEPILTPLDTGSPEEIIFTNG